jgi:hypothetical protein
MFGRSKLNRPSGQEVPGDRAVKDKAPVSDLMYGYANQGIKGKQVRSDKSTSNYQKAVQKDTKKKKKRALGRRTHKAAQGLLQRPTRKSQY